MWCETFEFFTSLRTEISLSLMWYRKNDTYIETFPGSVYPSAGICYLYANLHGSIFQKTGIKISYFIKAATDFPVLGSNTVQSYVGFECKIFFPNIEVFLTEYATYFSRIHRNISFKIISLSTKKMTTNDNSVYKNILNVQK